MVALGRCLTLAFKVDEQLLDLEEYQDHYMDRSRYTIYYQVATLRAQLNKIETLLRTHLTVGGLWLHRLELCITIVRAGPRQHAVAVGAPCYFYRVADVPPSSHWTRKVAWFYLPRFQALADEVVFFGQPQALSGPGLGVRQLPPQAPQPHIRTQNQAAERVSGNTRRRGR